ncbi:MAG: RES family NAD+ phosphorylase [Candidatus Poribacteria bacterium]|nr:RES family NAD+ phosphorylase [Candidatus Poribacteria bacterium]
MSGRRASHDVTLLDALADLPETTFEGEFWRVVHGSRPPIDGSKGAGRWNRRESEVLYCALEKDGAISEIYFHISRGQSVFPSRLTSVVYQMRAWFDKVIDLTDMALLAQLGIDTSKYQKMLYGECQRIGEAVGFLGFGAMLVPNARHSSSNLVVFPQNCDPDLIATATEEDVDWQAWRQERRRGQS